MKKAICVFLLALMLCSSVYSDTTPNKDNVSFSIQAYKRKPLPNEPGVDSVDIKLYDSITIKEGALGEISNATGKGIDTLSLDPYINKLFAFGYPVATLEINGVTTWGKEGQSDDMQKTSSLDDGQAKYWTHGNKYTVSISAYSVTGYDAEKNVITSIEASPMADGKLAMKGPQNAEIPFTIILESPDIEYPGNSSVKKGNEIQLKAPLHTANNNANKDFSAGIATVTSLNQPAVGAVIKVDNNSYRQAYDGSMYNWDQTSGQNIAWVYRASIKLKPSIDRKTFEEKPTGIYYVALKLTVTAN